MDKNTIEISIYDKEDLLLGKKVLSVRLSNEAIKEFLDSNYPTWANYSSI